MAVLWDLVLLERQIAGGGAAARVGEELLLSKLERNDAAAVADFPLPRDAQQRRVVVLVVNVVEEIVVRLELPVARARRVFGAPAMLQGRVGGQWRW